MIYIHIPYCKQRCIYCNFYSVATRFDKQPYIDAICKELLLRKDYLTHKPLKTIYFGGGSPSILTKDQLQQIFSTIEQHYDTSLLQEVTLEANPEHLTNDYLAELSSLHFINRLSIGVQSFHDNDNKLLNRRHNGQQAIACIQNAQHLGFKNISLDLIYGIPYLSDVRWEENLNIVASLNIQHLSCYALTVEPGTMLDKLIQTKKIIAPDEEIIIRQFEMLRQWCNNNGFEQYEISNFCKSGYISKHNSNYWNRTPYLGIGASAHSYNGFSRQWNISDTNLYIRNIENGILPYEEEKLSKIDLYNEYLMTALRTSKGLDIKILEHDFPDFLLSLEKQLPFYFKKKWIEISPIGYRLTQSGILFADQIASDLFI